MKPIAFWKFYPGDWLRDTMHLDATSTGAYVLLLIAHRGKPGIPSDDLTLRTISRVREADWGRVKAQLAEFFKDTGGLWVNNRCIEDWDRDCAAYDAEVARAKAGAQARWKDHTKECSSNATSNASGNAQAMLEQSESESESESDLKRLNVERITRARESKAVALNGNRSSPVNRSQERELVGKLTKVLGKDEMERAGGHWRVDWIRKDPDLVARGIGELQASLKEGKTIQNRGAYLEDLLRRWK
jgi:uncharacterized protein YdaU (DUF1376 family)